MRIYPEQLSQSLEKGLLGCYLLFGSEPLLKQESKEQNPPCRQGTGI